MLPTAKAASSATPEYHPHGSHRHVHVIKPSEKATHTYKCYAQRLLCIIHWLQKIGKFCT